MMLPHALGPVRMASRMRGRAVLLAVALACAPGAAGPAVFGDDRDPAGAAEDWHRRILEWRDAQLLRMEQEARLRELEAERDRLIEEQRRVTEEAERLEARLRMLEARAGADPEPGEGPWISLVETVARRSEGPPRSVPPMTVVEARPAEAAPGRLVIRLEDAVFEARTADFAQERELLAHLEASAGRLDEEAQSLEKALDRTEEGERAAWREHIERLRRRAGDVRRSRAEVQAAFEAWRETRPR